MNRDTLIAERERLVQAQIQAVANANACNGAIQLIDQLLAAEEGASAVPVVK